MGAEDDRADLAGLGGPGADQNPVEVGDHALGSLPEDLSGGRERHAAAGARQQLGAGGVFEAADLLGDRGLRDSEPLGGAAEVQLVGHGQERPQLTHTQIDHEW